MIDFSNSKNSVQENIITNRKGLITAEKMRETLDTLIDDAEKNIADLQDEVDDVVKEQLKDVEEKITTVEGEVNTLSEKVNQEVTKLNTRIDGTNGVVGNALEELNWLSQKTSTLETEYDSLDKITQSMLSDVEELGTDVKELKNLPLKKGTRGTSSVQQDSSTATGSYSTALGYMNKTTVPYSIATGYMNDAYGNVSSVHGDGNIAENYAEFKIGKHSTADKANPNTWSGADDLTLFKVGNGESTSKRHDALKIMQNGDVYVPDTNAEGDYASKPMIKLQDNLFFSWVGTQDEYDGIGSYNDKMFYFITDGEPGPTPPPGPDPGPEPLYPNNEIHYNTTNNQPISFNNVSQYPFKEKIVSNAYRSDLGHYVITFDKDLTYIPQGSFTGNSGATYLSDVIWIPNTLEEISSELYGGNVPFSGLSNLKTIYFGNNMTKLKSIGKNFLNNCSNLVSVDMSGMVALESIGNYFLQGSSYLSNKLETLTFGKIEKLTKLGDAFLLNQKGIKSLDITGWQNVEATGTYFMQGSIIEKIYIRCNKVVAVPLIASWVPSSDMGQIYIPSNLYNAYCDAVDKYIDNYRYL